ncbi:MAG: hypothetical protein AAFR96_06160 [Planctomycetota bacterium]
MNVRRGTARKILLIAAAIAAMPPALLSGCEAGPSVQAMRSQGDRALDDRDYAAAAEWYEMYVSRRPIDPEVRYRLGTAYLGLKKPIRAREEFLQGLEMDNDVDRYIEGIAAALVETGQRERLFGVLGEHARNTRQPTDYILFGKFAAIVGDPDTAEEAFLEAAKLDKGQTIPPQLALADFYGSLGDTDRELQRLRMALFLDTANEVVNTRIRNLGEVSGPTFALMPAERQ